jgi:nucleoside-diphosphate-sugar epimerase
MISTPPLRWIPEPRVDLQSNRESRRALVTGATGFIGSHLLKHLEHAGWIVGVIARPSSTENFRLSESVQPFSYSGQTAEVMAAVEKFKPDVMFHLASLFLASHTPEQVESLISSNVLFGLQLLEAMQQSGCRVLVNAGTGWQNYRAEPPFDASEYMPVNLYAATKQAFEDIALYYVQTSELRLITLRLFDSYGPGDTRRKLLRLLLETLKTGQPLAMSPGDQVLDLAHVDDICRAFLHAAELGLARPSSGAEVYAISGGQRRTLREVAAILEEAAANRKLPLEFDKRPHRPREVMHPWEGPRLPGWEPQISLLEGFRRLIVEEVSV